MTSLSGAHVIVTGGSEGIGLETARSAAGRGARVSLIARRPEVLDTAAAQLGGDVAVATADVSDPEATMAAMAEVVTHHGPADVLIANAGYALPGRFLELPATEFRREMEVNYLGAVHAIRAVAPSMIERGRGHLVVVSSTAGLMGVFGYSAYSPTKFALRGLAETLRAELGPAGVRVAIAFPPDTVTPGFDRENESKPPETEKISSTIKPISSERMAAAIVRGIESDRLWITADALTAALVRGVGVLHPLLRALQDRDIRSVSREIPHATPDRQD